MSGVLFQMILALQEDVKTLQAALADLDARVERPGPPRPPMPYVKMPRILTALGYERPA